MTKADPQTLSRDDLTLTAAFLIALAATLGALFIGEVLGQMPCTLCWYQRIAMFPLVPILGLSLWRGDGMARAYALPLVLSGLALAAWFYGGDGSRAAKVRERFDSLHRVLTNKYYIDELYEAALGRPLEWVSERIFLQLGDRTLIDGTLHLLAATARGVAAAFGGLQAGGIHRYALYVVLGLLAAIAWSVRHV